MFNPNLKYLRVMPELPEVENMKLGLDNIKNNKIIDIYISGKKLREPIPSNICNILINDSFSNITRIAKYLVFHLHSSSYVIVAHAGMSGKFTLEEFEKETDVAPDKHDHLIIKFDNNTYLKYNDPRRFGMVILENKNTYLTSKYLKNIGIDALSQDFTAQYLFESLQKTKAHIKGALLNQNIVAGLGNIYVCEALYETAIIPTKKANELTLNQCHILVDNIKNILQTSIALGGSTLKDYKKVDGSNGGFQNHFKVYGKLGVCCPICSKNNDDCNIQKIVQNGRSTFFCKNIQK